jgi:hypothetical protein
VAQLHDIYFDDINIKKKVNFTLEPTTKSQVVSTGIAVLLYLTLALVGVGGKCHTPAHP